MRFDRGFSSALRPWRRTDVAAAVFDRRTVAFRDEWRSCRSIGRGSGGSSRGVDTVESTTCAAAGSAVIAGTRRTAVDTADCRSDMVMS